MLTALDISKYLISLCQTKGISINNLYLQKLLYYTQGYSYRITKKTAFPDDFVKWQFGPTILEVYFEFNIYRSDVINRKVTIESSPSPELRRIISQVVNQCSAYSLRELVDMATGDPPCLSAKMEGLISKSDIRHYFSRNDPLHLAGNNIEGGVPDEN